MEWSFGLKTPLPFLGTAGVDLGSEVAEIGESDGVRNPFKRKIHSLSVGVEAEGVLAFP